MFKFFQMLFALIAFQVPTAFAAEPLTPDKMTSVINIYDAVVQFPAPSWQATMEPFGESELYRNQKGSEFIFEQIPKGESFQKWSQLYAVHGFYLPNADKLTIKKYANLNMKPFIQSCGRENIAITKLQDSQSVLTIILFCTASPHGPKNLGYSPDNGEIALMTFRRQDDTFIKVYHEWRGPKFNAAQQSTWPVASAVLNEMIRRFQTIHISKSPRPVK